MEGRRPKYLYCLKKGKIKGYRVHEDGKEYITNLYTPGDYIGYLPLLENAVYGDSAEALEDSEFALIPKDEFLSAVYNDIQIATRFIRLIAQNVQEKEERLLALPTAHFGNAWPPRWWISRRSLTRTPNPIVAWIFPGRISLSTSEPPPNP